MTRRHSIPLLTILTAAIASASSGAANADLIADSKALLELRNMYMNRDFRNANGSPTQDDWGQGFTLRMQSGFTEGQVGFGLDAIAQLGLKLDSTAGNSGTGVLAVNSAGVPEDDWSELGLTAKAKIAETTLRLGTLQPTLPVVMFNDTRLLSGTYTGAMLTSYKDIDGLLLNVGRITESNLRDSSSRDDTAYVYNRAQSDHFDFAGGAYDISEGLTASYYYGELEDVYSSTFWAW